MNQLNVIYSSLTLPVPPSIHLPLRLAFSSFFPFPISYNGLHGNSLVPSNGNCRSKSRPIRNLSIRRYRIKWDRLVFSVMQGTSFNISSPQVLHAIVVQCAVNQGEFSWTKLDFLSDIFAMQSVIIYLFSLFRSTSSLPSTAPPNSLLTPMCIWIHLRIEYLGRWEFRVTYSNTSLTCLSQTE